jgi:hypothetical protein
MVFHRLLSFDLEWAQQSSAPFFEKSRIAIGISGRYLTGIERRDCSFLKKYGKS